MSRMGALLLLTSLAFLTSWSETGWGEEKTSAKDLSKDLTKRAVIEKPTANIVKTSAATESSFVNPKVEAGAVKWHATFDDACKAAVKSGKPVLLFQMMGKLDERFC